MKRMKGEIGRIKFSVLGTKHVIAIRREQNPKYAKYSNNPYFYHIMLLDGGTSYHFLREREEVLAAVSVLVRKVLKKQLFGEED